MKTVIIGGVAGGASAAARLRRLDENAEIIILEMGEFVSFANCGLPYYVGGDITSRDELLLQTPESFKARFNVDVRVFSEAVKIDRTARTVEVRNSATGDIYTEAYDRLILSPGASSFIPPIAGADNERVFTVKSVPDAVKIREYISGRTVGSAVVVGGGYIGVEMAENLTKAGLNVTIIEMASHIITSLDYDMARLAQNYMENKGIRIMLSSRLTAIESCGNKLRLLIDGAEAVDVETDLVVMASGVKPNTGIAAEAGLALSKTGAIIVDEYMRSSDENIYAVGDAVEICEFVTGQRRNIPLAGPANKQGRIAADNICGRNSVYKGTQGSAVMKVFDMTIAVTGITEESAKNQNIPYDKVFTLSASNASYYPGGSEMSVKTIFNKITGKILGAQIIGYSGADKRCDVIAAAIRTGMDADGLTELELCYAPPFSSAKDPVNFVGYVIKNTLDGLVKNFHWHDIADLPKDGSVTLLDVRTAGEYAAGHIDSFINIGVDQLRENLSALDKNKPIYVHCRSGLRSYIACRILTQNGFDCFNLSGGYLLWSAVTGR